MRKFLSSLLVTVGIFILCIAPSAGATPATGPVRVEQTRVTRSDGFFTGIHVYKNTSNYTSWRVNLVSTIYVYDHQGVYKGPISTTKAMGYTFEAGKTITVKLQSTVQPLSGECYQAIAWVQRVSTGEIWDVNEYLPWNTYCY